MRTNEEAAGRAQGALFGLAIGDALGMPTQLLPRARVRALFPTLAGFLPGPAENPISAGQPAGTVTDDTEQALIVARVLLVRRSATGSDAPPPASAGPAPAAPGPPPGAPRGCDLS